MRWAGPPQDHLGHLQSGSGAPPPLGTAGLLGTLGVGGLARVPGSWDPGRSSPHPLAGAAWQGDLLAAVAK